MVTPIDTRERTRIAICAATLHRPVGLASLLKSLAQLEVPDHVDLITVIVDNDADGSASSVVESARADWPHADLRYGIEAHRGIPFARNRAVSLARDADWVAFIDDDEVADPLWIVELLRVATQSEADVVTGRVVPAFEQEPPSWVINGDFFERRRFATGTRIQFARTSNALVAMKWFGESSTPFSEAMANNGGDDTHFFQRVRLGGGRIIWADEAVVIETVPVTRVQQRWLVQREYRRGNTLSLCLRDLEDSPRRRAKRCAAATVHAVSGVGLIASSVVRGRVALVRGTQRVAFSVGLMTGLTGHVYEEYATVHGS